MDDRKLPLLPEPYSRQWINCPFTERLLFTEEQMRAYARAALAAAPPEPDTSAEDALWHGYAGQAMLGLMDAAMSGDEIARYAADMADAMLTEARKRGRV